MLVVLTSVPTLINRDVPVKPTSRLAEASPPSHVSRRATTLARELRDKQTTHTTPRLEHRTVGFPADHAGEIPKNLRSVLASNGDGWFAARLTGK